MSVQGRLYRLSRLAAPLCLPFLGGWKAGWWNLFARFYGASLKTRYEPNKNPKDALTERIVLLVEEKRI